MAKKENTFVAVFLEFLYETSKLLPLPFETSTAWVKRQRQMNSPNYYANLFKLEKRGVIEISKKNAKKFVQLTKKGELEVLLNKAKLAKQESWDGKWRLIIYDIPERCKELRFVFRRLLKRNNFLKLQASVFVSPYPLNTEAIKYLYKTGLNEFVRIIRADKIDDDKKLCKYFSLSHNHK